MQNELSSVLSSNLEGREGDRFSLGEETVRGEVLRVVFTSDDGAYTVLRLQAEGGREMTLVGGMGGVLEGQDVEASGRWERHKEHGWQFRVRTCKAILPHTETGVRRYLASGIIPGIGPKLAERIVAHFGTETLSVLEDQSARLREIPGLGMKRIRQIKQSWQEHQAQRDTYIFFQGLGLGPGACNRILARYGQAAVEIVQRNPYRLCGEVWGIGFLTSDQLALKMGIDKDNPLRLAAGIAYTLQKLSEDGHTCYPRQKLLEKAADLLDASLDAVITGLDRAVLDGAVIVSKAVAADLDDYVVYERRLFQAETGVAERLLRFMAQRQGGMQKIEVELPSEDLAILNQAQRQAVSRVFESRLSIITGGPGVGKTMVVGRIVQLARRLKQKVLLAAPTGRAAKRLGESCRVEAKTIHRMLRWDPQERSFAHNADRPLRCDLLIVDEVSMLDIELMNSLLDAVPVEAHLLFVGDRDQLPSVGPGSVLHDMIASGRVAVTNLTEIYRQEEGSRIVFSAHAVNRGNIPDLNNKNREDPADFYWVEQSDPHRVNELIATMIAERIPAKFNFDPMSDVQVLAPMNKGVCGTLALNSKLQATLNPGPKSELFLGERCFRLHDRVMQVVNNYDKGVFNGELGQVIEIDHEENRLTVAFDVGNIEYERVELDQLKLAYAVTVNKSQGSEFPVVVMPLLTQHYIMLQRNLVYTGMTRARRLLIMIGTRKALAVAIRNDRPALRYTRLKVWLAEPDKLRAEAGN